jgi:hypothetical protein
MTFKKMSAGWLALALLSVVGVKNLLADSMNMGVYPDVEWAFKTPAEVGLDDNVLNMLKQYAYRGCVVRYGYMVKCWNGATQKLPGGCETKPLLTHWLFKAVEEGRLSSIDDHVNEFEPRLNDLNADLGYKDRDIRWRHMATQSSGYSTTEEPGTSFDYNTYNMALFGDTLLLKVYGAGTWSNVNTQVVKPKLTDVLQLQDNPSYDGNGRFPMSVRDWARVGLLYLRQGKWKNTQLISQEHALMAVTTPHHGSFPNSDRVPAEMIAGQRTFGNFVEDGTIYFHVGSYSFAWWINGLDRNGHRLYPDAPTDLYFAHTCCSRLGPNGVFSSIPEWAAGTFVIPSLDIVLVVTNAVSSDPDINDFLRTLVSAVTEEVPRVNVDAGPDLTVTLPNMANLNGTVIDGGAPATVAWTKVSGPGTVAFGNANVVDTTASFSAAGAYVLRLTATRSAVTASDEATVTVLTGPSSQSVTTFTLINADTDQPIAGYDPLPSGAVLNLTTLPTRNLNIRANTSPATVGSVRFALDGISNFRTESASPYALVGDDNGDYSNWTPALGRHTLKATPFSKGGATGTMGTPHTIIFHVTQ